MATKRSQEASSSSTPAPKRLRQASSSSTPRWNHDVFLSFRGEDTRTNFTDHLYHALVQVGIHTFRDDDELERGEDISSELLKAIERSQIAIIVFSRNYASSGWCLDELVKILECRETMGQIVIPVFYNVDPSDVRKQSGSFVEAFARHEERFVEDLEKVERWKSALTQAANLSGWDLKNLANGHESRFIQGIVDTVMMKLNQTFLNVAKYPIGMESHVQHINMLLNGRSESSDDVRIVGIYGMGGIGKTTIAKAVYNLIFHRFEGCSFLANVREVSKQHNGLVHLQKQLLRDVLRKKLAICNIDRGINLIKQRLRCKRVLVILDDVDELNQLNSLAEKRDWFGLGSRIIITTRDEHLLKNLQVDEKYKVIEMNRNESLQLFSLHAFRQDHPSKDYMELSIDVVSHTGGLPLALEVLGSFLCDKTITEWRSALEKLQRIPDGRVMEKLKISFDGLDESQKNIFLHVACFFIRKTKNWAIGILESCGMFSEIEIRVLADRSLVTIDEVKNTLSMHDLLRDMGREIVRNESPEEPGARSRLWFHEDIHDVLKNHTGTEKVEALILDYPILKGVPLRIEAFANMENIKVLKVNGLQLAGEHLYKKLFSFLGEKHIFKKLRWLCWHGFNLQYIPTNFSLENLVSLEMQHSSIIEVWKGSKMLRMLEVLNLSHSHCLIRTPNFSEVPNLKRLMLEGCTSLVEVHKSIGHLNRLVLLNMKDCKNLYNLPSTIFELKSLEELDLSGCSKLDQLPESLGNMGCLRKLFVNETAIKQLPQSIVHMKNLKSLSLGRSKGSTSESVISFFRSMISQRKGHDSITLPVASFSGFCSLTRLTLRGCNFSEGTILSELGSLSLLEDLDLRNGNFCSLPSSISALSRLLFLDLCHCTKLQSLPKLPSSISHLTADDCTSLERLPNLSNNKRLAFMSLQSCNKLIEIEGMERFESILAIQMESFLQGLNEGHNCTLMLPMREIPECFEYQSMGSSMSFNLQPRMGYEIQGFIICSVIAAEKIYNGISIPLTSTIQIEIQGTKSRRYSTTISFNSACHQDNMSLEYYRFPCPDSLEGGDQVNFKITMHYDLVKSFGVHVVYVSRENASMVNFTDDFWDLEWLDDSRDCKTLKSIAT